MCVELYREEICNGKTLVTIKNDIFEIEEEDIFMLLNDNVILYAKDEPYSISVKEIKKEILDPIINIKYDKISFNMSGESYIFTFIDGYKSVAFAVNKKEFIKLPF